MHQVILGDVIRERVFRSSPLPTHFPAALTWEKYHDVNEQLLCYIAVVFFFFFLPFTV